MELLQHYGQNKNGGDLMAKKKNNKRPQQIFEDNEGVAAVQNQLNESYQSGVIEEMHNNKNVHTFNNQKN
ncbi:hypothetical protein [Virgibacillus sp. YIM 98842]|uniref:hypothetical protein n=1 Tax=Virgibacillus sp. YIM 98842 TaxID=2663533 RepID=UPI0013DB7400|nr:hypothetical protein [Virgibacillus sp. YIM 98842]